MINWPVELDFVNTICEKQIFFSKTNQKLQIPTYACHLKYCMQHHLICFRCPISFFPSLKDGPMPVTAWHMTADTTTYKDEPQKRDGQGGKDMNQQAEANVQPDEQAFAPMPPTAVMRPFQGHEGNTGDYGEPMPKTQTREGNSQNATAEEHTDGCNVQGSGADVVPSKADRNCWTWPILLGKRGGPVGCVCLFHDLVGWLKKDAR